MRVGFIQFTPRFGQVAANIERLCEMVAAAEADLLVLPELCTTGYQFSDRQEAWRLAEPADGEAARQVARVCAQHGRHVVLGIAEQDGHRLFNSALLVGPGGLVGVYRKVHLFWDEPDWSEPGDLEFQVFDIGPARVGVMICFDYAFPEAARSLALAGADIIAHPSNLVLPLCQRVMPVRALENRVFTITTNRCGVENRKGEDTLIFTGGSMICGPGGEVMAHAGGGEDETVVLEIDPARAREKAVTPRNDALGDRRPGMYRTVES